MSSDKRCDLCDLSIDGPPVIQTFDGEEKQFCCQGCARVYQVAHEAGLLDQITSRTEPKRPGFTDLVLAPGQTAHFSVGGMWCAGCASAAEQILRRQPGVKDAVVNFASEQGRIDYDPEQTEPAELLQTLDALGYEARLRSDPQDQHAERLQERLLLQLIVAAGFGMQVMLLYLVQLYPLYAAGSFGSPDVRKIQYLVWALATPILLVGGWSFLKGAWRALRARTATMDTLVALGTLSAYSYSVYVTLTGDGEAYFDSVAMITTFILFGRYLERLGGARARKDIRHLLRLQPEKAWRRSGDSWHQVRAGVLATNDTILIKPGERVPADAEILSGEATVDESLLTGESTPVRKVPGDTVYAGTVVTDDALVGEVLRPVERGRLAQIAQIVERTLNTKPPIQRLADRASTYFALGIVAVAGLTFLGWWLAQGSPSRALLTAVAVLVVACPCALGLATPLALAITLGRTSQAGILVRNPVALETAATVHRVVLDKTGTLTRAKLSVTTTAVASGEDWSPDDLLCLAAAVEQVSEHPIARAIVSACPRTPAPVEGFRVARGLGASAQVKDHVIGRVLVGSSRFLEGTARSPLYDQAKVRARQGETIVWVGWDGRVAGFVALRDEPRPDAASLLRELHAEGIQTAMLSGDHPATTQAIAAELEVDDYAGGMSPQEKAGRIQAWQEAGETVAMVGDGVNDAPALAQADLAITAAGGTDVAGETSDVVLAHENLMLIPWFIRLSQSTRRIVRENLAWAFAYNLVAVPLAALGVISPVIAAAAMATSSLLVVGNSLRLRR